MACMEHECQRCKHHWFDNQQHDSCPRCGWDKVSNWFDEDHNEENDYEDFNDDDTNSDD